MRRQSLALPLVAGVLGCPPLLAATLTVSNCNDAGDGSLRAVLATAGVGDVVDLAGLACSKISLATGELVLGAADLTLRGPGADRLVIDGGKQAQVINHRGSGLLTLQSLSVTAPQAASNGTCVHSAGSVYLDTVKVTGCKGIGVYALHSVAARYSTISDNYQGINVLSGPVDISRSTISGNRGAWCSGIVVGRSTIDPGGLYSYNIVSITNSTISSNFAFYYDNGAGCLYEQAFIGNSTIAMNGSNGINPGLLVAKGSLTAYNSIFANNTGFHGNQDLLMGSGEVAGRNNLIMLSNATLPPDTLHADPQLLPLADNGGATLTHSLAATSPAIDAGDATVVGFTTDQRGTPFQRSVGANTDIGALELQATPSGSLAIGPGFTGSWYDPNQSGHGLTIEVLTGKRFLATWFAFDPAGKQAWFTGVGTYTGNTATIDQMLQPEGARWIPNFHSADVVAVPWGPLTFTFSDCSHGRVDFNSTVAGFGSGHMDLTRLTIPAGLSCP